VESFCIPSAAAVTVVSPDLQLTLLLADMVYSCNIGFGLPLFIAERAVAFTIRWFGWLYSVLIAERYGLPAFTLFIGSPNGHLCYYYVFCLISCAVLLCWDGLPLRLRFLFAHRHWFALLQVATPADYRLYATTAAVTATPFTGRLRTFLAGCARLARVVCYSWLLLTCLCACHALWHYVAQPLNR
jgi:hypothetical protein